MVLRHLLAGLTATTLTYASLTAAHAQTSAPKPPAPVKPATASKPATTTAAAKDTKGPSPKPAAPKTDAASPAGGTEPTLAGQFGIWGAYVASPGGRKVCFVLAKPSSSKTNPPGRPRDPAYAFVSTRPAEHVKEEVSVAIGYTLKPGSEASIEASGATFAMYTQGDGIWIKNAAEEPRLVDAMRKSSDVVVKGVSTKGTETSDTFSAKGLAQALDKAAQSCR
jgi:hypothetical protein